MERTLISVIIYTASSKIFGGSQLYTSALCNFLNLSGLSASVLTSRPDMFRCPTKPMESEVSRFRRLVSVPALARRLAKEGVRLVVLDDLSSLWLAPLFRVLGFRVIALVHLELRKKRSGGFGHNFIEFTLLKISSLAAHRVLSVGRYNITAFPRPVEFVGNFVPSWFFEPQPVSRRDFDLGFISRFSKEKNLPLFLDLVGKLGDIAKRPMRVLMVGDGPDRGWLRSEVLKRNLYDHVEIRPWIERTELPAVFARLKVFAITSHYEGFPTTALEAHAQGVPIVSHQDAGYTPAFLVRETPVTGVSFRQADLASESFHREVLSLLSCDDAFRESCRQKAARYNEHKVLGKIRDVVRAELNQA